MALLSPLFLALCWALAQFPRLQTRANRPIGADPPWPPGEAMPAPPASELTRNNLKCVAMTITRAGRSVPPIIYSCVFRFGEGAGQLVIISYLKCDYWRKRAQFNTCVHSWPRGVGRGAGPLPTADSLSSACRLVFFPALFQRLLAPIFQCKSLW